MSNWQNSNWQSDAQKIKQDFDHDGYVLLRGFCSPEQMQELSGQLDRYVREVIPGLGPEENFYEDKDRPETLKYAKSLEQHDEYFQKLFTSDQFVGLAELLLEGPVVCRDLSMFDKPARVGAITPAHQEGYYFMLSPSEALTMWLAIDPVDEENGCIRYVRGSNRRGLRDHHRTSTLGFSQGISDYGPEDEQNEAPIIAQPGDLLVHHCDTIHRADANLSDRPRRAFGFVYFAARAKSDTQRVEEYQKSLMAELAETGKI
ncbi:MAG TPA: phytanoyl-CoA dioxygenase family protein [Abditibacteriaceae bacterium]|nr:phytanoyl-CoA dioxygenase family protein [Abditibacteriaceae bacterium]